MSVDKTGRGMGVDSLPADSPLKSAHMRGVIAQVQHEGLIHRRTLKAWSWRYFGTPYGAMDTYAVVPFSMATHGLPWYMQKQSTKINAIMTWSVNKPLAYRFRLKTINMVDAFANTTGEYSKTVMPSKSALRCSNDYILPYMLTVEATAELIPTALPASRRFAIGIDVDIDALTTPAGGTTYYFPSNLIMWDE